MKSVTLRREDMRGEDDVDDVGEGGPKLEDGINVCGDGEVELLGMGEVWLDRDAVSGGAYDDVGGANGEGRFCRDRRCAWGFCISGDVGDGEVTTGGVAGEV